MTDYKTIRGKKIKTFATDLDNDQSEGQIFYSSTDNQFKAAVASAAWHSSGSLNTARDRVVGAGTITAGVAFGGATPPNSAQTLTEEYNGSGFATGGALSTGRFGAGPAGRKTAALAFSGRTASATYTNDSEEYNGSAWTAGGDYPVSTTGLAGAGTQTAGLGFGGGIPGYLTTTNEYDGSSWTSGGALNNGRSYLAGFGIQTSAVAAGGAPRSPSGNLTEEYNGSSWTASNTLNTSRDTLYGNGTETSGLVYGGNTGSVSNATESYNGSTWTSSSNLGTARKYLGGFGTAGGTTGVATGGDSGSMSSATEEFNITVNTVTAGAWASGGNLNTGRTGLAGAGSQTAALAFGGTVATPSTPQNPYKNESEEYNGSSWTEGNNLNQARSGIGGGGTQTAAYGFGGLPGSGQSATANSEEYNGTSWSEGNNLNTASYQVVGGGPQTAGMAIGGATYTTPPSNFAVTDRFEYYDGTSWSEQNDLNTARYISAGCGLQTAALYAGGNDATATTAVVEEWNGTSWSEVNNLPTATQQQTISGTQTAAIQAAGSDGSVTTEAFFYDGTNWTTAPSVATARSGLGAGDIGATQTSGIIFGGHITPNPSGYQQTEEFTGETTALNLKTITDS